MSWGRSNGRSRTLNCSDTHTSSSCEWNRRHRRPSRMSQADQEPSSPSMYFSDLRSFPYATFCFLMSVHVRVCVLPQRGIFRPGLGFVRYGRYMSSPFMSTLLHRYTFLSVVCCRRLRQGTACKTSVTLYIISLRFIVEFLLNPDYNRSMYFILKIRKTLTFVPFIV